MVSDGGCLYSPPSQLTFKCIGTSSRRSISDLYEQIHVNKQSLVHVMKTPAASYLIPPKSGFLMADMTFWYDLLAPFSK